jgi:ribosomal protein S18 acetylase RimI-like enzyme
MARQLIQHAEHLAQQKGFLLLRLSVRATRLAAIQLYEASGFVRWGELPYYERVQGEMIPGYFYYKQLTTRRA